MVYKLFLDDERIPCHCVTYMHSRIGIRNPIYLEKDWVICRNYNCFVATIEAYGLPVFISFDHDLALEHYTPEVYWDDYDASKAYQEAHFPGYKEKTGYECAKWLVNYCEKNDLDLPECVCHSQNPIGTERILSLLKKSKWEQDDRKRV